MSAKQIVLMDARAIERTLRRMAEEIVEVNEGVETMVMVGIQRRGVQLAARIAKMIEEREGTALPLGSLDITLYRDDLQTVGPRPLVGPTNLPWNLDGKRVVIVDDVLFTGRTIRAALDELTDFGRAARIELAVLIERAGRELPIHPDFVGKKADISPDQRVDVLIEELDGRDAVVIASRAEPVPR
jgi:pyrimidine operon attenuation protein/uracil phosphoribosyltransferase